MCCGFCMTFVVLSQLWRECIGVCWDLVDKLKKKSKSYFFCLFWLCVEIQKKIYKKRKTQQNTFLKNRYSCALWFWRKIWKNEKSDFLLFVEILYKIQKIKKIKQKTYKKHNYSCVLLDFDWNLKKTQSKTCRCMCMCMCMCICNMYV